MKRLAILFILLLVVGMLFGACGAKPEANTTEPEASSDPAESQEVVTLPTKDSPTPNEEAGATADTDATTPSAEMGVGERGDYEDDTKPAETKPTETKPAETKPVENQPDNVVIPDTFDPENTTIEMWEAMTSQQQDAFQDSFPTLRDFINWYNSQKAKEPTTDSITSDDNTVDLGQLIKP